MKKQGAIVKWDDARGFGFIRSAGSSAEVFFHVRDFQAAGGSGPQQGLVVTFEEIHVGGKGPRGMAVQPAVKTAPATARPPRHPVRPIGRTRPHRPVATPNSGAFFALPLMVIYAAALTWGVWVGRLPWWVFPLALFINLLTFFAYWKDKWAAGSGGWRTSEKMLHTWSAAGGWPGAWFGQQVLRHKSRKESFRSTYWTTVVLHCAALGGWLAQVI
jgi:uncharacterized membrane protein YsdA (DUF1294 family)/cold shock CspA family protein